MANFDVNVRMANGGTPLVFVPLGVPSKNNNSSVAEVTLVPFDITVHGESVDSLEATISNGKGVLYRTVLPSPAMQVGTFRWPWAGIDSSRVLDTAELRSSSLLVKVVATKGGVVKSSEISLSIRSAGPNWVDSRVDYSSNKALVTLRLNVTDGGSIGAGENPPTEVQGLPGYGSLPAGDPRKVRHSRSMSYLSLRDLVLRGVKQYWSRKVTDQTGTGFDITVSAIASKTEAMDDIAVVYNTNRDWARSSNPGAVRDLISLFGNAVPERIVYNVGWIEFPNGWHFQTKLAADQEFSRTAAHEVGHEILSAYGGSSYSYGHKGSSTVMTQKRKAAGRGGINYPSQSEIDLMKYYNGTTPVDYFTRSVAAERDTMSLLWLSRLEIRA